MTVTRERFLNDAAIVDKLYAEARRERSRMLKAFFSRLLASTEKQGRGKLVHS